MKLGFLKPKIWNVLITIVVLCIPFFKETAPSPGGGYSSVFYRPIFLLATYLQIGEYYAFFLMFLYSLFIYLVISVIIAVFSGKLIKK